jgi:hypothetical protein
MTLIPLAAAADRLMIINDFDAGRPLRGPHETNPPLIIDAYRMLSLSIACQGFKLVAWRSAKIGQDNGSIDHLELAAGDLQRMPDGKPFGFSPANTMRVRLSTKALIMDL